MNYVIIGNSAAAIGGVEGIRRLDKDSPITVISSETQHTYSRPLISYHLAGKVTMANMAYRPEDFYSKHSVTVMLGQEAVHIDAPSKTVALVGGDKVNYDKLLIATGSRPTSLEIPGISKSNVFPFYSLDDTLLLQEYIKPGMKAVVLGAGLTALKAAEALVALGVETTLVVRSRILRNFLDAGAGSMLAGHLEASGLKLAVGSEPTAVMGDTKADTVLLADGRKLQCDFVISAIGIAPNTILTKETAVEADHGILVDGGMRTSVPDIFAAGDVAQGYDLLLGCRRVIPLLPVAYAQGEVAGRNMAGDGAIYAGMGMNAVNFFGLPIISAGIIHENVGDEVQLNLDEEKKFYRKLIFRDNLLIGFVLVSQIDRAGILTWLIREKINIISFKESLLLGSFNYAHLPANIRNEKLSVAL